LQRKEIGKKKGGGGGRGKYRKREGGESPAPSRGVLFFLKTGEKREGKDTWEGPVGGCPPFKGGKKEAVVQNPPPKKGDDEMRKSIKKKGKGLLD